jgi:hypothetical protein
VDTPDEYGLTWENLELKTKDGILLRCYLLPQRKKLPVPSKFQLREAPLETRDSETDEDVRRHALPHLIEIDV